MSKLKALKPSISSLSSRVRHLPQDTVIIDRAQTRDATSGWYKLARWKRLRWATFVRDKFECQMCGRVSQPKGVFVCDHIEPHRGDEKLFWDPDNLQTLCADPCHNKHKQRLERGGGLG